MAEILDGPVVPVPTTTKVSRLASEYIQEGMAPADALETARRQVKAERKLKKLKRKRRELRKQIDQMQIAQIVVGELLAEDVHPTPRRRV